MGRMDLPMADTFMRTAPTWSVACSQPTGAVTDRLILTSLESVWRLHGQRTHGHDDPHENPTAHDDDDHQDPHVDHDHHREDHGHHEDRHVDHAHARQSEAQITDDHDHHQDEHTGPFSAEGREAVRQMTSADGDAEPNHDGMTDAGLEITALLLRYRTPLAAVSLPREVNATSELQAASPAGEITRLLQLVGLGIDGLRTFAWVLIATACLSVFAALYGSLKNRRGDLAMLRCLGATRLEIFLAMMSEGLLMSIAGIAPGFGLGHLGIWLIAAWLETGRGVSIDGIHWVAAETQLVAFLLIAAVISALLPSVQAYRTDVARTLAERG